jgi:hypothetical protein
VPPQSLIPARVKRPEMRQRSALFQAGCYFEKQREFELTSLGLLFSHLPGEGFRLCRLVLVPACYRSCIPTVACTLNF